MKNVEKAAEQKCLTEKMKGNTITQFMISDGIISPSLEVKGEMPKNGMINLDDDCSANSILTNNNNQVYVSNDDTKEVDKCTGTSCPFSTNLDEDDEKYECFNFDEETGTILKYDGQNPVCQGDIYIPAKINNVPVTRINHLAFTNSNEIICEKDGVVTNHPSTYIPAYEETGCYQSDYWNSYKFNSLNMKDAGYLTEIGYLAFTNNELNEVIFNDNLKKIGHTAFLTSHLSKLVLPKNLMELGNSTFQECEIEELVINNKLKVIPRQAFSFNLIKDINIPEGVEYIEEEAFAYGDWESEHTTINISDTVKSIGPYAFMEVGATEVNFGNKLEYIGDYAFYTNSITEVEFSNSLKQIGECAFGDNKLTDLFVYNRNSDGTENKKSINSYGGIESTVTIPNQVEEIGLYAFDYAEITNLTLNEGLKYIREGALSDNIFSSITIPSTVEVIEKDALLDNENLSLISNKSGRSFDWSSITGSSYANQIFATGTINHDNGEIQVTN
jgi:hypothetical protein